MNLGTIGKLKKLFLVLCIACFAIGIIAVPACDRSSSSFSYDPTEDYTNITWPTRGLATMLPEPPSLFGEINNDSSNYFSAELGGVSEEEFLSYVAACEEKGFTEDYSRSSSAYFAENLEGYQLSLRYNDDDTYMSVSLNAPSDSEADSGEVDEGDTAEDTVNEQEASEESPETPASEDSPNQDTSSSDGSLVTPSFKEAMDSYEAFFDEYIAFMKKYEDSANYSPEMLEDFSSYMDQYAETMEKLDAIDENTLSPADHAYYTEVMTRINQKLLDV